MASDEVGKDLSEEWRMATSYGVEVSDRSRVRNPTTGYILKASSVGNYLRVTWGSNGKCERGFVHKLVADAFLEKPSSDCCIVDHIDGNPLNNHWTNLRYCSHSINSKNRGTNKNNTSGEKGVRYHKGYWIADWYEESKRHRRNFSVKQWGHLAKVLATDYRIQKEIENGGYPPRESKRFWFHGDNIFQLSQLHK
jgi:hypothetical protein